jgi:hypothetical protein
MKFLPPRNRPFLNDARSALRQMPEDHVPGLDAHQCFMLAA